MITLKTYGPSDRGDVRAVSQQGSIFSADFASENYSLGPDQASFADLFTHTRGTGMRYVDPVSRQWVVAGADDPIMLAPDGQKALMLSGTVGAVTASVTIAGAGSSTNTYTAGQAGLIVPVMCYGPDGAEVTVSGDVEFIDQSATVARPYRSIFVLLTGGSRSLTVHYNDLAIGYKVGNREWDEWLNSGANPAAAVTSPTVDLQPTALAAVEGADVLDVSGRYIPNPHYNTFNQVQNVLSFTDAAGVFVGLRLNTNTNIWEFSAGRNIPLLRPKSATPAALTLDFRIVWDRTARLADVWANGRLVIEGMTTPAMGAITAVPIGRSGSNPQPRCSVKYLTCRAGL